jgi:type I restriction enzyme S subunit
VTELVSLGEVLTVDTRAVAPEAIRDGSHYVGLESIGQRGTLDESVTVDAGELKSSKFAFDSRHVLFGKLRPNLGKVARPTSSGICSTDIYPLLAGERLDRGYLAHFLLLPSSIARASSRTAGVNLPRISARVLKSFEIPLPPLPEQRRIAAILDQVDELRHKRAEALGVLDSLFSDLFVEMFGNPLSSAGHRDWKALGELGSSRLGKMLDAAKQTGEHRVPYLRNANVRWFKFDLSDLAEMDIPESERSQLQIRDGDVLICEGGEPGRAAVWRGNANGIVFQKALHRFRTDPELLDPDYLAQALWFLAQEPSFGGLVTSATIAHLTGEKLRSLRIPVPPVPKQRAFAQSKAAIAALSSAHRDSLTRLDELFASLQHRAFAGEL